MESRSDNSPTDHCLRAVDGPNAGKLYPLAAETRVGRDPHADVFVGHGMVPRWQCVLVWEEETCRHFLDRGWFRRVFVNGRRVGKKQRVALQTGDRITIADTTFVYEHNQNTNPADLVAILTDETARTAYEVFRRCEALERLSACGITTADALPSIMRSLLVRVSVDCVLALRVAAAEAVWKVGGRHDLALPFLAWALKDEYWGVSRKATEVLAAMGSVAHDAVPDLVNLAERRLNRGPFFYEDFGDCNDDESLLATIARALGICGRGLAHVSEARRALKRIVECQDADACAVAHQAVQQLQDVPPHNQ